MKKASLIMSHMLGFTAAMSMQAAAIESQYERDRQRELDNAVDVKHVRCVGSETPKKIKKSYGQKKMTRAQRKKFYSNKGGIV